MQHDHWCITADARALACSWPQLQLRTAPAAAACTRACLQTLSPCRRWNEKFDFIDVRADSVLLATVWDQATVVDAVTSLRLTRVGPQSARHSAAVDYTSKLAVYSTGKHAYAVRSQKGGVFELTPPRVQTWVVRRALLCIRFDAVYGPLGSAGSSMTQLCCQHHWSCQPQ
jgi:hypothetical protein